MARRAWMSSGYSDFCILSSDFCILYPHIEALHLNPIPVQDYRQEFIEFALSRGALRFGSFKLKSGRTSPYFFNSGLFDDGESLRKLGDFYARAIMDSGLEFDMLFGPAYKGIPLVCAVAMSLSVISGRSCPFCFDRKEAKDHGEGGLTVGAPAQGRIIIVDDVISAGTSVNHAAGLLRGFGANPVAVAIALDRQERGSGTLSALEEIEQNLKIRVLSIIKLLDIVRYLERKPENSEHLSSINDYLQDYGIN